MQYQRNVEHYLKTMKACSHQFVHTEAMRIRIQAARRAATVAIAVNSTLTLETNRLANASSSRISETKNL